MSETPLPKEVDEAIKKQFAAMQEVLDRHVEMTLKINANITLLIDKLKDAGVFTKP